ncbi:MAG: hypothetical protein MJY55_03395 [Bacteroidales bacterium]|nr:hypothetical protein [Bacteroidales bacterium]
MKKLFILVAAALLSISANAQWYVGGIVDMDIQGNKTVLDKTNTTKTTSFSFTFAPEVGYYLSDKLAVGASLSLSPRSSQGESSFRWSISPYVRYKFWGINKFGICGQAYAFVGTSSSSDPYPTVNYGVNILPVLTYALNEHFTLDAYIDCAGIGYNGSCTNNKDTGIKNTTNQFGFTVASQGQLVGIGFHYNF